ADTEVAQRASADTSAADLQILGYGGSLAGLQRGVAAHHAGMLPIFKEVVEELFEAGYVRAVFATETLALGVNMPARTVVIERLGQWDGETHGTPTPGGDTPPTRRGGRGGRRIQGPGGGAGPPRPAA